MQPGHIILDGGGNRDMLRGGQRQKESQRDDEVGTEALHCVRSNSVLYSTECRPLLNRRGPVIGHEMCLFACSLVAVGV